jgi:AcrR family transcriptional regulator
MARSLGIDRAQVIAVAADLADAIGLERLTLAQIATRLGVKLPSLYNHVAGLPGLKRELALLGARELLERLRCATIGKAGDAAVLALAQAFRAYILAHPGRYAASLRAPTAADPDLQQLSQAIVEVVLAVLEPYRLDADAAIHAVRGLRSLVHGFAMLELAGGFGLPLDRDASFHWLLRMYTAGLRTGAPADSAHSEQAD